MMPPTTQSETHDLIEELRKEGAVPRCHGNGFIQLDVDVAGVRRFHFWGDPRIPRQRVYHGVHDHRFGFTSTVLAGRMLNVEYKLEYTDAGRYGVFEVKREADSENTKLVKQLRNTKGDHVKLWNPRVEVIEAGESYTMFPRDFHESLTPEPTITFLEKTSTTKNNPRVLVPARCGPDNEFHRDEQDTRLLWDIIYDMLPLMPR